MKTNKRFFNFRRHDFEKWAGLCGFDPKKFKTVNILNHFFICEDHFSPCDYKMVLSPLKRVSRLKKEAVPKPVGKFV